MRLLLRFILPCWCACFLLHCGSRSDLPAFERDEFRQSNSNGGHGGGSAPDDEGWLVTLGGVADDDAYGIAVTNDGDLLVSGWSDSFLSGASGWSDAWLISLDHDGQPRWQMTYGLDGYTVPFGATATDDGGAAFVGRTENKSMLVARVASDGQLRFQKRVYSSWANDRAVAIDQGPNGQLIVAGTTANGGNYPHGWLGRFAADGELESQFKWGGPSWPGEAVYAARSVVATLDGAVVVAGDLERPSADDDMWLVKLSAQGELLWQQRLGAESTELAKSVIETHNGDLVLVGASWSFGAGTPDMWILRLDKYGQLRWQRAIGAEGFDSAHSVVEAPDGSIVVAGVSERYAGSDHDLWLGLLDESGALLWQRRIGTDSADDGRHYWNIGPVIDAGARSVVATSEGIFVASATSSFGAGEADTMVLRVDYQGNSPNCAWVRSAQLASWSTNTTAQPTSATVKIGGMHVEDLVMQTAATDVSPQFWCGP